MKRIDQVIYNSSKLRIMPDVTGLSLPLFIRADLIYQTRCLIGGITAINFPDEAWEHVLYGVMCPSEHVPDYEEMVWLKDTFFNDDEVAIQVHPRTSDNISLFETLHLWRHKLVSNETERDIRERELNYKAYLMDRIYPEVAQGTIASRLGLVDGRKVLAIISKDSGFPTWYDVKALKERYWGPEGAAVQYNFGKRYDLKYPILLVWDASGLPLPPKRLI